MFGNNFALCGASAAARAGREKTQTAPRSAFTFFQAGKNWGPGGYRSDEDAENGRGYLPPRHYEPPHKPLTRAETLLYIVVCVIFALPFFLLFAVVVLTHSPLVAN